MLGIDLGIFQRRAHKPSTCEALTWSAVWVGLALLFNGGVYFWFGSRIALEFFTGYLVEKSLSVDNLFVFLAVFSYLSIPAALQHRVLFCGILGALILRGVFIIAGTTLLHLFHWAIYVFGAILVIAGIRLWRQRGEAFQPQKSSLFSLVSRSMPIVNQYEGARFTIIRSGHRYATPLLLALVVVELADLMFAMDSIPAIFAITPDPFIVFTSNIFAVLGLRSLYFLLAAAMLRFRYLGAGLALVLGFVGLKMLFSGICQIPIEWSLAAVSALIFGSMLLSLRSGERSSPVTENLLLNMKTVPSDKRD